MGSPKPEFPQLKMMTSIRQMTILLHELKPRLLRRIYLEAGQRSCFVRVVLNQQVFPMTSARLRRNSGTPLTPVTDQIVVWLMRKRIVVLICLLLVPSWPTRGDVLKRIEFNDTLEKDCSTRQLMWRLIIVQIGNWAATLTPRLYYCLLLKDTCFTCVQRTTWVICFNQ